VTNIMRNTIGLFIKYWLIAILPMAASGQNENAVVDPVVETNALTNFTLLLTFATNTFTNREPIRFQVGLSNMSDSPILVLGSFINENYWLYITNSGGVRIPMIDEQYSWLGARGGRDVVSAHGTESLFRPDTLNSYYKLVPDTYRICAIRDVGNDGYSIMYTSRPVTITILEAKASTTTNSPSPPGK